MPKTNKIPVNVTGKVVPAEDGKFGWVVSVNFEGIKEYLQIDSRNGNHKILYDTNEEAQAGIREHASNIIEEVIKAAGGPKKLARFERRKW